MSRVRHKIICNQFDKVGYHLLLGCKIGIEILRENRKIDLLPLFI